MFGSVRPRTHGLDYPIQLRALREPSYGRESLSCCSSHAVRMQPGQDGKTGSGDVLIKDTNFGGDRHLIIDVACTHEFCGNYFADVGCNG